MNNIWRKKNERVDLLLMLVIRTFLFSLSSRLLNDLILVYNGLFKFVGCTLKKKKRNKSRIFVVGLDVSEVQCCAG